MSERQRGVRCASRGGRSQPSHPYPHDHCWHAWNNAPQPPAITVRLTLTRRSPPCRSGSANPSPQPRRTHGPAPPQNPAAHGSFNVQSKRLFGWWMVAWEDDVPVCQHFRKDEINSLARSFRQRVSYLDEHVPLLQVVWWLALAVRCLRRLGDKSVGDVAQTDLGGGACPRRSLRALLRRMEPGWQQ